MTDLVDVLGEKVLLILVSIYAFIKRLQQEEQRNLLPTFNDASRRRISVPFSYSLLDAS